MKRHIYTFNRFSMNENLGDLSDSEYERLTDLANEIYEEIYGIMAKDSTGKVLSFFDAYDEWDGVENKIISEIMDALDGGFFAKYVSPDGDLDMDGIIRHIGLVRERDR